MKPSGLRRAISSAALGAALVVSGAAGAAAAVYVLEPRGPAPAEREVVRAVRLPVTEIRGAPAAAAGRGGVGALPSETAEVPRFQARPAEPEPATPASTAPGILALGGLPVPAPAPELATSAPTHRRLGLAPDRAGPRARALSPDDVRRVVKAGMPAIRRCYERSIRRQGFGLEQDLELSVRVSPSGSVRAVDVSGTSDERLGQCVGAAVAAWSFPPTHEGAALSAPVRLRPTP